MKIWYQSLSRHGEGHPYWTALRNVTARAADAGTQVDVHSIVESGGVADDYRVMEFMNTRELIYNAAKAQTQGYDAFVIGNITDAGLREAREMTTIPVLGLAETVFHLACIMGGSFGLVTVNDKFTPRVVENVGRYGLTSRLAGIRRMQSDPQDLKRIFSEPAHRKTIVAGFIEAARGLSAEGAEVVIPCGGVLMAALTEDGVHEVDRAPVLNGIIEIVKLAEMAVKTRALTGRFTSKRLNYASPTGETLELVRKHYGRDMYPGAA